MQWQMQYKRRFFLCKMCTINKDNQGTSVQINDLHKLKTLIMTFAWSARSSKSRKTWMHGDKKQLWRLQYKSLKSSDTWNVFHGSKQAHIQIIQNFWGTVEPQRNLRQSFLQEAKNDSLPFLILTMTLSSLPGLRVSRKKNSTDRIDFKGSFWEFTKRSVYSLRKADRICFLILSTYPSRGLNRMGKSITLVFVKITWR